MNQSITGILTETFGEKIVQKSTMPTIPYAYTIPAYHIAEVCQVLYSHSSIYCDHLTCITAIDNHPTHNITLVYLLYSIPNQLQVAVYTHLQVDTPTIPTVSHIWHASQWHEREVFDLMGIHFTGHPDLRRILLPDNWEGHPLRKNYTIPTTYHGIPVPFEKR